MPAVTTGGRGRSFLVDKRYNVKDDIRVCNLRFVEKSLPIKRYATRMNVDEKVIYGADPEPTVSATPPAHPKKRLGKAILVTFLVFLVGFISLFSYVNFTYARGVLPNTTVNGLSISGLSAEAAESLLERDLLPQHQISIKIGDEIVEPNSADLGITYPVRETVNEAFSYGHESSWPTRFVSSIASLFSKRNLVIQPTVDKDTLKKYVDGLVASHLKEAANAALVYSSGQVSVQAEQVGQAVDGNGLYSKLLSATTGAITGYDVEADVAVVTPEVTDEALTSWRDRVVKLTAVNVTITTPQKSLAATKEQKLTWFTLNKDSGQYAIALNEAAVNATLTAMAKKINLQPINDQVDDSGNVIVVGQDGYNVDIAATQAQLLPLLRATVQSENNNSSLAPIQLAAVTTAVTKQQVRALAAATGESVAPAIDTDARFAQISLSKQRMYLFENRQLINVFTISSGKAGYETPRGVHKIYSKSKRAWSRTYSLYLPYWNAITADGGYGIHDLPEWPGGYKEPETHLGTPVSHGCIRLGTAQAQYFFDWAPMGMAVVVQ